jgi:3-hydroxybutyrate dehydrogenase
VAERVAVVTGAASGIGREIALQLAGQGHRVVVADRDEMGARTVASSVSGLAVGGDLARREDCRHLIDTAVNELGRVDVLVNNAGFQHVSPVENFPEDVWETMQAVMLTAPFLLTRYAWPHMKARGWGRIVNISSIHGLVASPFKSGYVAAKHGLVGFTRAVALEGGEFGITVNAICPGFSRTSLVENQVVDLARSMNLPPGEVVEKVMLGPAAIKRLVEPAEIASLVCYLVSDMAGAITGVAWPIDAGWTAR